jgi:hypothetical protein
LRITLLIAASAIAVASCSDSTSPDASTLSFTYTGAGSAAARTFSITGDIAANTIGSGTLGANAWAAGSISATSSYSIIGAVNPRSSTRWDIASIGIALKTAGTSPIDPACNIESDDCTGVFVALNLQPDGDDADFYCGLTTGSVTITAVSATKVSGSFSGSGMCANGLGDETPFTVSDGAFNVAVTTQLLDGAGPSMKQP